MEEKSNARTYIPVVIVTLILFTTVIWAYTSAKNRTSTIVLPGGITYLGPSPSPAEVPLSGTKEGWSEHKGALYPYIFSYPATMNLGVFPNDPTDAVTAFIDGTDANANIFFRVEPCKGGPCGIDYAKIWWKQYNWKEVKSVTEFTNKNSLRGYRATYISDKNETPYDHIFFEIPGKKDLIIWLSGRLFSKEDFERMIDSVNWKE